MSPTNSPQSQPGLIDQLKNFLMGNAVLQHLANGMGGGMGGSPTGPVQPLSPGAAPAPIQHFGNDDYIRNAVNQYMQANPTPPSVKRAEAANAILGAPNTASKAKKGKK